MEKLPTNIRGIRSRATVVFSGLLSVFALTVVTAVLAGAKSGELESKILHPANRFLSHTLKTIKNIRDDMTRPAPSAERSTFSYISSSSASFTVTVNGKTVRITPAHNPESSFKSATPAVIISTASPDTGSTFDMDAWTKQIQDENRRKSEEAARQYEQFKARSDADFNTFKARSEADLKAFRENAAQEQQQFLKSHGITPFPTLH